MARQLYHKTVKGQVIALLALTYVIIIASSFREFKGVFRCGLEHKVGSVGPIFRS